MKVSKALATRRARVLFVTGGVLLASGAASAVTAPASGTLAFDAYDVVVNQMLNGPIGFVGGLGMVALGAVRFTQSWIQGVSMIGSGSVLLQADTVTESLGAIA